MPEEVLAIIIVSIVSGTMLSLIRMILAYRERKMSHITGDRGSSLTMSELESMMRRAVNDATDPINDKLDQIEIVLGTPRQIELARVDILEEMDELEPEPVRRRTRERAGE